MAYEKLHEKVENLGIDTERVFRHRVGSHILMSEFKAQNDSHDQLHSIHHHGEQHLEQHIYMQFLLQVSYGLIITLGLIGLLFLSQGAFASERDSASVASKKFTHSITDGYGIYKGQGSTQIAAQSEARTYCVMSKVAAYERKHGVTPDEDVVDLYFDACINR
jgi:hypothetical protein